MEDVQIVRVESKLAKEINAFLEEFEQETQEHPFSRFLRVWNMRATFEVGPYFQKGVVLGAIQALKIGNGDGSSALDWFLNLARKHGVTVYGTVSPLGKGGLTNRQLRAWYKRHGFRVSVSGEMIFIP